MNDSRKKRKGFTLVETLVAITILTVGIVAPLTAVSRALNAAGRSKDNISAFYFAQEGVETIRYIRDTNILNPNPAVLWLDEMGTCEVAAFGTPCRIRNITDMSTGGGQNLLGNCGGAGCQPIWDNGTFGGSGGVQTKFVRSITVEETVAGFEAEIVVTVEWSAKGTDYTYTLRETLFNWSGN